MTRGISDGRRSSRPDDPFSYAKLLGDGRYLVRNAAREIVGRVEREIRPGRYRGTSSIVWRAFLPTRSTLSGDRPGDELGVFRARWDAARALETEAISRAIRAASKAAER